MNERSVFFIQPSKERVKINPYLTNEGRRKAKEISIR